MAALDEHQIREALGCHPQFLGCFAADEIPRTLNHGGFIANTDTRRFPGSHWIAIYVDEKGVGEFFDSYGLPPVVAQHLKFLKLCKKWKFNRKPLQSMTSSLCGQYAILYLDAKFHGMTMKKFLLRMTKGGAHSNDAHAYIVFKNNFVVGKRSKGQISCCKLQLRSSEHHGRISAGHFL